MPSRAGHEQFHSQSHDVKATGGRTAAESADRFESLLQELIVTERSYVRRVETLYKVCSRAVRNSAQEAHANKPDGPPQRYAVPLRQLARDRDTAIIPLYEAQRLFGNIGEVLGANAAFLNDLQGYLEAHEQGKRSISLGEVIYRNVGVLGRVRVCNALTRPPIHAPRWHAFPATTSISATLKRQSTLSKR